MMNKVKTMYSLMAERYAASPFTQHQADVYRKILALAGECDSVETMTRRLQAEGYNAMPAAALMMDKLTAHLQAAEDNGLAEHAGIYRKALAHLKENPSDAYLTGYYDDVKKANIRYAQTLERLLACFNDFMYYDVKHEILPNVKLRYDDWGKEGKSLSEVCKMKVFRNHFGCSDTYLQRFINEYNKFVLLAAAGKQPEPNPSLKAELEQAWNEIKDKKAERQAMAQSELPKCRKAAVMSIAPASADGDYEYINEEFEN